jgi:hypothetical protein
MIVIDLPSGKRRNLGSLLVRRDREFRLRFLGGLSTNGGDTRRARLCFTNTPLSLGVGFYLLTPRERGVGFTKF